MTTLTLGTGQINGWMNPNLPQIKKDKKVKLLSLVLQNKCWKLWLTLFPKKTKNLVRNLDVIIDWDHSMSLIWLFGTETPDHEKVFLLLLQHILITTVILPEKLARTLTLADKSMLLYGYIDANVNRQSHTCKRLAICDMSRLYRVTTVHWLKLIHSCLSDLSH